MLTKILLPALLLTASALGAPQAAAIIDQTCQNFPEACAPARPVIGIVNDQAGETLRESYDAASCTLRTHGDLACLDGFLS